jgi:hypothetical protein
MKRIISYILWNGLLLIVWGIALLAQHIACFDVFESNLWYLYLLAVIFAVVQWIALFLAGKYVRIPGVHYGSMVLYGLGAYMFFFGGLACILTPGSSWGLSFLCVILDICGIFVSYRCGKIPNHPKGNSGTGDGR